MGTEDVLSIVVSIVSIMVGVVSVMATLWARSEAKEANRETKAIYGEIKHVLKDLSDMSTRIEAVAGRTSDDVRDAIRGVIEKTVATPPSHEEKIAGDFMGAAMSDPETMKAMVGALVQAAVAQRSAPQGE